MLEAELKNKKKLEEIKKKTEKLVSAQALVMKATTAITEMKEELEKPLPSNVRLLASLSPLQHTELAELSDAQQQEGIKFSSPPLLPRSLKFQEASQLKQENEECEPKVCASYTRTYARRHIDRHDIA